MTAKVVYEGELRTTCTHLPSSSSIETDAPTDNYGKGERFSPTDLMAISLATCMITVMGIKATTMGLDMGKIEAEVEKIMKPEPRRIGGININFSISEVLKNLDEKDKETLKRTAETCPVMKSIHPDIDINIQWNW